MARKKIIPILCIVATLFALSVIGLGAFTRLVDAGLGCPDWPGCYGHFTVPQSDVAVQHIQQYYPKTPLVSYKAKAEMVHRYFAGMLSILIVSIIASVIYRGWKTKNWQNLFPAMCLLSLLIYQIALGMWTVTLQLLPIVVTQHLLGGFLIISLLWFIYLRSKEQTHKNPNIIVEKFKVWGMIALGLVLLQILLGAWTSTNYASLSCKDFPFCSNEHPFMRLHILSAFNPFTPVGLNYEGGLLSEHLKQTIQVVHRIGALVLTVYLCTYLAILANKLNYYEKLQKSVNMTFAVLFIQLCLGISNVLFKLPVAIAVLHNMMAAILLLSVITVNYRLYEQKQRLLYT